MSFFKLLSGKIARATANSGWYDLFSSENARIYPNVVTRVPTGVVTEMAATLRAQICEKSGRALAGLRCHGGCIDADYRGKWAVMMSFVMPEPRLFEICDSEGKQRANAETIMRDGYIEIPAGTAIAQFKLEYVPQVELVGDGIELSDAVRGTGGYGSTEVSKRGIAAFDAICNHLEQCRQFKVPATLTDLNFEKLCGDMRLAFNMSDGSRHLGTLKEVRESCIPELTVVSVQKL